MRIIDVATILRNIRGFAPGPVDSFRYQQNDIWHWFKHCFALLGDTPGLMTVNDYIRLAQEIGRKAADGALYTYVKVREDIDEVLVYWEPMPRARGLFMVVPPQGQTGEIATLFSPDEGKRYFDLQPPIVPTLHLGFARSATDLDGENSDDFRVDDFFTTSAAPVAIPDRCASSAR